MRLVSASPSTRWGAIMKDETLLGPWVRRFLLEHLVAERNLARNTQVSYRDTLALLLPFASKHGGRAIDRMTIEDLAPSVIRKFLDHLVAIMPLTGVPVVTRVIPSNDPEARYGLRGNLC